jgi:hypothetical protein
MKIWVGGPEPTEGSITATLLKNGVPTAMTFELTPLNNWSGSFEDLDKYDDMTLLPYDYTVTLDEADIAGFWVLSGPVMNDQGVLVFTNTITYHDETAWGRSVNHNIPFTDPIIGLSNWGWTNGTFSRGDSDTLVLYAGAGGNKIDASKIVGTVDVTYTIDGTVTIKYNIDDGIVLRETHFWVGSTRLPMIKSVPTNAPGQFKELKNFTYDSATGIYTSKQPFSGTIYVAAHAVVGIPYVMTP